MPHGAYQFFLLPLPSGEGGRRPGEGSTALGDPTLGGKRLLATFRLHEVAKLEVFLVSRDLFPGIAISAITETGHNLTLPPHIIFTTQT